LHRVNNSPCLPVGCLIDIHLDFFSLFSVPRVVADAYLRIFLRLWGFLLKGSGPQISWKRVWASLYTFFLRPPSPTGTAWLFPFLLSRFHLPSPAEIFLLRKTVPMVTYPPPWACIRGKPFFPSRLYYFCAMTISLRSLNFCLDPLVPNTPLSFASASLLLVDAGSWPSFQAIGSVSLSTFSLPDFGFSFLPVSVA